MAVTASGLYCATFADTLNAAQLPVDLTAATLKLALFNNSLTPNFNTDKAFGSSPFTANQVSGTGWAAGGVTLSSPTLTVATGNVTFDAADVSASSTTLTAPRCAVIYADGVTTPTAKPALCLLDFGGDYSTTAGTFSITFSASGIFVLDLTP